MRKASDTADAFMGVSFQAELDEIHNRTAEGSGKMEGGK
jgi:hypothetical protein